MQPNSLDGLSLPRRSIQHTHLKFPTLVRRFQIREEIDQPKVFETYISIINLSFKEGNKWFVNDGNESFYIIVEDKNFLKRIDDSMVKFSKGDLLKIQIRKVQFYNFDKKSLRSEYFVEKVLEHKTPSKIADLFDNI